MSESKASDLSKLRIDRSRDDNSNENSSGRKYLFIFGGIAVAAAAVFFLFFRGSLASSVEVQAFTVTAVSPAQADAVLTASGYVVAQRQAAVASKATGRLEFLGVEEGDQVKAGQIIARLEHSDILAALAQAKAELAAAKARLPQSQADLQEATIQYNRYKQLVAEQLVPRADYDAAEARYKRAAAAVVADSAAIRSFEASVRAGEVALEYTNIRAPFDGTVLTKNADVGEIVAPFGSASTARAAVVSIADMSSLEVEADVSESNIQRVKPGQPCEIVLDAYQETRYPGVVSKIVPTADRAKATVMTKIKFVQSDERVLPEMSAKVSFLSQDVTAEQQKPLLAVNPAAVARRDGRAVLFVVRDDRAFAVPVTEGATLPDLVAVSGEVKAGDRTVLRPPETLQAGALVKVVAAK